MAKMKIIKSLIFISALIVLIAFLFGKVFSHQERSAGLIYAVGGIEIDWDGMPFDETNFLPGDVAQKTVKIKNSSGQLQRVGFRIGNGQGYLLSFPLFLKITDKVSGQIYYGGSGGLPLFLNYVLPTEIKLFDLSSGKEKTLKVEIRFIPQAGNQFQGQQTKFDFSLGFIGKIIPKRFPFFPFF